MCFRVYPLPLSLSQSTTEESLTLHLPFSYLHTLKKIPHEPCLPQAEQSQLSQSLLLGGMFQSLDHLCGPLLILSAVSMSLGRLDGALGAMV